MEQRQAAVYHARQPRVAIAGVKHHGTLQGLGEIKEEEQVAPVGGRDDAVVGGAQWRGHEIS